MIANSNDAYQKYFQDFVNKISNSKVYEQKADDSYKTFHEIFSQLFKELKYNAAIGQSSATIFDSNNMPAILDSFRHSYGSTFGSKTGVCRHFAERLMIELCRLNIPNGLVLINRPASAQNHAANIYLDKDGHYKIADLTTAIINSQLESLESMELIIYLMQLYSNYGDSKTKISVVYLDLNNKFCRIPLDRFLSMVDPFLNSEEFKNFAKDFEHMLSSD